jgi:Sulfotransferase family
MAAQGGISLRKWWRLSELEEYEALSRARLRHVVEVREPLVLISQIQRSGGTLLSQLFDGHVEVHAHPQQLHIGHPSSRDWPPLDLDDPERCFTLLYEKKAGLQLRKGYRKSRRADRDMFPFCFLPRLQHAIFQQCFASRPVEREREVLDCYFTSYFNAWLDNHNLYTGPKKVVTGFAPRLGEPPGNVDQLFDMYPDGFLVSLVRDPRSWYASVSVGPLARKWPDVHSGVKAWRRSVQAALDARERFPERVLLLTYEQLVGDTERSMRWLAARIGLTMSPVLLTPTFNGRPIRANSSFPVERHGVLTERMTAYRERLDPETIAQIEELAGDLYDRAAALSAAELQPSSR